MSRDRFPFDVTIELPGWQLMWARLTVDDPSSQGLAARRAQAGPGARERFASTAEIAADPVVAALRRLFRAAGCDPTRYRPSSEALLRRLVKGDEIPEIQPLVDVNNCLSARLAVPCCVMAKGTFGPEVVLRAGRHGESYESLRGPFNAEAKPLLADGSGPIDTPITGNVRVKVTREMTRAWLVAYLPAEVLGTARAIAALEELLPGTGVTAEAYAPA